MGDLSAERAKLTHNTRLSFEQSSKNEKYLYLLYRIFKEFVNQPPKSPTRKPHIKTNRIYSFISFKTLAYPIFNFYFDLFYIPIFDTGSSKLKIIPENISDYVTDISLSYWIMDDGYFYNGSVILCTDSYSYEGIQILIKMLKSNFNANIINRNENSWRIQIKEIDILRGVVREFIIDSMKYIIEE